MTIDCLHHNCRQKCCLADALEHVPGIHPVDGVLIYKYIYIVDEEEIYKKTCCHYSMNTSVYTLRGRSQRDRLSGFYGRSLVVRITRVKWALQEMGRGGQLAAKST